MIKHSDHKNKQETIQLIVNKGMPPDIHFLPGDKKLSEILDLIKKYREGKIINVHRETLIELLTVDIKSKRNDPDKKETIPIKFTISPDQQNYKIKLTVSSENPYARIKARDIMEYLQQIGEITKAKENIDDTGMSKGTYTLKFTLNSHPEKEYPNTIEKLIKENKTLKHHLSKTILEQILSGIPIKEGLEEAINYLHENPQKLREDLTRGNFEMTVRKYEEELYEAIEKKFKITKDTICSNNKESKTATARAMMAYLLRMNFGKGKNNGDVGNNGNEYLSTPQIGRRMGKDHSTIIMACGRFGKTFDEQKTYFKPTGNPKKDLQQAITIYQKRNPKEWARVISK